jgi:hypothetical protein
MSRRDRRAAKAMIRRASPGALGRYSPDERERIERVWADAIEEGRTRREHTLAGMPEGAQIAAIRAKHSEWGHGSVSDVSERLWAEIKQIEAECTWEPLAASGAANASTR